MVTQFARIQRSTSMNGFKTLHTSPAMSSAPPGKKRRVETTEHVGTPLEPLASAVVVLRSYRSSSNGREIETLPHVVDLVSSFLDCAFPDIWNVERACEHDVGVRMLK